MVMWFARILIIIVGPIVGYFQISSGPKGILIGTGAALIVIFVEWLIEKVPLDDIIAAFLGIVIGLITAKVLDYLVVVTFSEEIGRAWVRYSLLLKIVFGYVGMLLAVKKKSELYLLDKNISFTSKKLIPDSIVVDSCVLIEGRIIDVAKSGFILTVLVIPRFIISELQTLADSADDLKRTRGRRGLQTISAIEKKDSGVRMKIYEKDYPEIQKTDEKLLQCCRALKARLMTTDFNLAQVAEIRGVPVLNLNALAKALKPIVLPGEALEIFLLREGKEHRQAVGYLDDGTMVVVEDARRFIGSKRKVAVTSSLQTDAGRMIFAKLDNGGR
ncbi:MAG: PIN domain-containing protein [bacterium]